MTDNQIGALVLSCILSGLVLFWVLYNISEICAFFRDAFVALRCGVLGHKFTMPNPAFLPITPTEEEAMSQTYCARSGCSARDKIHSEIRPRRPIDVLDTERRQWEFVGKVVASIEDKQRDWEWAGDIDYRDGRLVNEKLGISISADKTCGGGKEVGGFSKPLGMPSLKDYMRVILTTACESWLIWDRKRRHMKALDEALAVFEPKKLKVKAKKS